MTELPEHLKEANQKWEASKEKLREYLHNADTYSWGRITGPLQFLYRLVHESNYGWHIDLETGKYKSRNRGEILMLIVGELAEAHEASRRNLNDDKVQEYEGYIVELVDTLIRVLDELGRYEAETKIDVSQIFRKKMLYNAVRKDHTFAHRLTANGKKV